MVLMEKPAGLPGTSFGNQSPDARPLSVWHDGRILVALVEGLCLLVLVAVMKNFLHVPAAQLSQNLILFIVIYAAFGIGYSQLPQNNPESVLNHPFVWSAMAILITLAIIAANAQ